MSDHEILKCSCGVVIGQCRCISTDKAVRVIEKGCTTCLTTKVESSAFHFEYLQPANRAVIDGLEDHEIVMAANQPEYNPLRCLAGNTRQGQRLSRWTLTAEQRKAVAGGADIFLEFWTFNQPMHPIRIAVSEAANPDYFRALYRLGDKS